MGMNRDDVTSLDEVVAKIKTKLDDAATVAKTKVLPGNRGKIMQPLTEANTLLEAVTKVLATSGMGKRLGFVPTKDGIQPVIDDPPDGD